MCCFHVLSSGKRVKLNVGFSNVNIYSTKKLREMCLRASNKRTVIFHDMCTIYQYEVSFYLSNECLFETIALTEAWKINAKVTWPFHPFSQNCHIVLFVYQLSL